MRITSQHWIAQTQRCSTSHWDERPDPDDISLIVVHCISLPLGHYGNGYIEDLFCGRLNCQADPSFHDLVDVRVSAHVVIDRRGRARQYVPFDKRAWHAGESCWNRRHGCNDFAIGIELEGTDADVYTAAQYRTLNRLLPALLRRYPRLSAQSIVGHSEIAPHRKTDPGPGFNWQRCLHALADQTGLD